MNILYVENHAIFAEQVSRLFLSGHRVTVVPSLSEARVALGAGCFDVALVDYDLDDGKGDVFVGECRRQYPELPVIGVSAHDAGNAALTRAGAVAICGKMEFSRIGGVIANMKR